MEGSHTPFNEDLAIYTCLKALYTQEAKSMAEVSNFVAKTVNIKYQRTCYKAKAPISK